jgi:hypothetical protein
LLLSQMASDSAVFEIKIPGNPYHPLNFLHSSLPGSTVLPMFSPVILFPFGAGGLRRHSLFHPCRFALPLIHCFDKPLSQQISSMFHHRSSSPLFLLAVASVDGRSQENRCFRLVFWSKMLPVLSRTFRTFPVAITPLRQ